MPEERKVVLFVDDEAGMRDMIAWLFAARAFDLVCARDGDEAVETLRGRKIDLIVTDVTMPRLNGFKLLAAARALTPPVPVIVLTGFGTVEMAVFAMRAGAADFLLKPCDTAHLAARMAEVMRADEASPARVQ